MNEKEVIEKIGRKRWKEFLKFMHGQTVGLNPNGTANYYEQDIENFLRKPEKRFWD